jgi:hypothetical protein
VSQVLRQVWLSVVLFELLLDLWRLVQQLAAAVQSELMIVILDLEGSGQLVGRLV